VLVLFICFYNLLLSFTILFLKFYIGLYVWPIVI